MNDHLKDIIPSEMVPALKPFLVTDLEGLSAVVAYLKRAFVFGFDIETNVVDNFVDRRIRTIQIGDREQQFIIDLLAFAGSKEALIASQGPAASFLFLKPVIDALRPFLESREWTKVGQGMQFEYEVFRYNLGIRCDGFFDLLRAEQNIDAGLTRATQTGFWGLEDIVGRYIGVRMLKDMQKAFDLETPLTQAHIDYAALDVRLPMGVRIGQLKKIREMGIERAVQIDCDAIPAFGDMKINGQLTDDEPWAAMIQDNLGKKKRIVVKLDEHFTPIVGTKFTSDSDRAHLNEIEDKWRECPNKTPEDKKQRAAYRAEFMKFRTMLNERAKLAADCQGDAAINYGSSTQILKAMRKMGYGEKKLPDTNDLTLEQLCTLPDLTVEDAFKDNPELDFPLIDLIRLYRTVDKQLSTYGTAWISDWSADGHRNPLTGRIHSNLNLNGTATGRTSSSSPNVQNIPKEKRFRRLFVARPGYKVLTVDMNGAELRILAEMSGEPVWLEAFAKGWDVHSVGAEILFGDRWKNATVHEAYVDEDGKTVKRCAYYYVGKKTDHEKCGCPGHETLRGQVKAINFGLAYGMGPNKLAKTLGITLEAAEALLEAYKAAFPTVMKYLDDIGQQAKTTLQVRSMEGGIRRWRKPSWNDALRRAAEDAKKYKKTHTEALTRKKYVGAFGSIEREGKNAGIQRTNAYMAKRAMYLVWLRAEEFGALWLSMIHDEIVLECPEDRAKECFDFIVGCFQQSGREFFKTITMEAEGHIENTWTK